MKYKLITQFFVIPNSYLQNSKEYYKEKWRKYYINALIAKYAQVTVL